MRGTTVYLTDQVLFDSVYSPSEWSRKKKKKYSVY
jgi:hypothetical protein